MKYKLYDAEIEYLESTDTQWIDTGVVPSSDVRLTIDGQFLAPSESNQILGVIQNVSGTYKRWHIGCNSNSFMGGVGTINAKIGTGASNSQRHLFQITGKEGSVAAYVDVSFARGDNDFPSLPMYFFARNFDGEASNMHPFRIYSAHIYSYSKDDKLHDFIPVRVGSVGYLYDKVSGQLFGNSGTGDFVLGPDVAPAAYANEIAFLESTGSQWIDNVYTDNASANEVVFDFQVNGTGDIIGNKGSDSYANGTKIVGISSGVGAFAYYKPTNERVLLQLNSGENSLTNIVTTFSKTTSTFTIEADGETLSGAYSGIARNEPYTMLVRSSNLTVGHFVGKIYSGKIYEDGVLVRDFIPVEYNGVGYLYDKVNGIIYGNKGTGEFIWGPIPETLNYVAFLESWGNQYIDTGIKPSTDTKIELKCLYCKSGVGFTNYGALIGADDSTNAYTLTHSDMANFTFGTSVSKDFANPQTRLLTFDSTASSNSMSVYDEGGTLVTTLSCIRGIFEVNQNLYLFAINRNGTPVYGSNRIMYCKIYDGDALVRDYVPVEYNGIGYMYDKVSGLFFDNQGTGKFLFGSIAKACARSYTRRQLMMEEARVKPYISDGLVFHLDGADATDTTWVDRVAGVVFELTGATPNGKGVSFNTNRNTDKALHTSTIPSSITSVTGTIGTIEVCARRTAVRSNFREAIYTTNRYSIQYVVESSGAHVALASSSGVYAAPRSPLPNGRELKTFTHSCNAARTCYNGTMIAPGSNTYITMYNYCVGNNEGGSIPFKGIIYQIRVYNRQLSEAEMKWNQDQDRKKYGIQF